MFIHYFDSNIREKTLLEVLQSPLFMAYHDGQPFNENHLRPCPMLENPELLREMISKTGGFPFYKRPRTLHRPKTVSQIPKGFILLKKGLCKTQSPFFCSYATEKIPSENENASEQDALFFVSLTVFEGQLGQFAQFILRELFIGQTEGIIGNQHR